MYSCTQCKVAKDRLCSLVHNLRWLETDYVQCKGLVMWLEKDCEQCNVAGDVAGERLCTM